MGVVIYGAGSIAHDVCEAINVLYPEHKPEYFLVSDTTGNPDKLCGIPVFELEKMTLLLTYEERKELEILIATPENVMDEIEQKLRNGGYKKIRRINSSILEQLMEKKSATVSDT